MVSEQLWLGKFSFSLSFHSNLSLGFITIDRSEFCCVVSVDLIHSEFSIARSVAVCF